MVDDKTDPSEAKMLALSLAFSAAMYPEPLEDQPDRMAVARFLQHVTSKETRAELGIDDTGQLAGAFMVAATCLIILIAKSPGAAREVVHRVASEAIKMLRQIEVADAMGPRS
jgi:hypothetical protein